MQKRIAYIFLGVLAVALATMLAEMLGSTPTLDENYLARLNNERIAKDAFLQGNAESPLPAAARDTFTRLPYYEPTADFKLEALFTPTTPDSLLGQLRAGTVTFTYNGRDYTLIAFWEEGKRQKLFIPFRDGTSGKETYGGGRYLSLPIANPQSNEPQPVELDFNYAYHPYCVYNPAYVCPVPPPQNRLEVAVTAGERLPQNTAKAD
jgi:uncharacterized protein (DUF1684 family)